MSKTFSRARAGRLLAELGVDSAPVDVEHVAGLLGLAVRAVDGDSRFSGRLLVQRLEIQVNADLPHHQRRFTIAHEIGHFILRHDPVVSVVSPRSHADPLRANEAQANSFAFELLMPEALVKRHWAATRDYRDLAALFAVSQEAMFSRLERLGLLRLTRRLQRVR